MKMKSLKLILGVFLLVSCLATFTFSQTYNDHFGTGNTVGVKVSSSSENSSDEAKHTLNGTGYFPDLAGASRFLAQSSLGANYEEIEYVSTLGIENWIDEQMNMENVPYLEKYKTLYQEIIDYIGTVHPDPEVDRSREFLSFAFYTAALTDDDVLRNKTAFALLQIFVIANTNNRLNRRGYGQSDYYDILYDGAFGNFRDMLNDVTLHLMMGYYLSHLNNRKGDPETGTLPDENYAREIMQLFTIGLYELNLDGSYKLDENGEPIPTYDITDVQELAKVFTGLSGGAYDIEAFPNLDGLPVLPGRTVNQYDMTVPMAMYEQFHETGQKVLVDGTILPPNQPGMKDIQDALDVLFNHPNVGPFISIRMIQQLVKSNPSPDYIERIATVFNDNGEGVRGDMGAVVKAILLDPEARDCIWLDDAKNGKLKQPIERLTNLFRAFDIDSPSGRLWFDDRREIGGSIEQAFMASPTVFNFFTPFYAEDNYVEPNDMVSPEFQILHAVTAINYLNLIEDAIKEVPFPNRTRINPNAPRLANNNGDRPFLNLEDEVGILQTEGISALLDRLSLILCHGQLSDNTKGIIESALTELINSGDFNPAEIVENALYFIMASPDYMIQE